MSSEVTTGYGNLMGYELYDLVALSENECAVVIVVGTEKLRVINHMGNVRDVLPQELLGKRNTFSARSTGFDVQQNVISLGDTVKVTTGFHAKLTGTVKQMMKGTLWLHSNSYLKNSGIFVIKTRNCVVAGGNKSSMPALSQGYKGVLNPAAAGGSMSSVQGVAAVGAGAMARGGSNSAGNRGGGRDYMIGKTVRITKGGFKGLLAQVVDATPTHYSVELLAKLKKIVVERSNTVFVGDEKGSLEKTTKRGAPGAPGDHVIYDASQTPYFTQNTPMHVTGSETPAFLTGGETPMVFGDATPSSRTPRHGDGSDAIWGVNDQDREQRASSTSTSMQNSPGHSLYSDTTSRRGGSGWGSSGVSVSSYTNSAGTDNSAYSGNRYSQPGSSGMSSMVQSGSSTPMSMMNEAGSLRSGLAGSSTGGSTSGAGEVTFRDWTKDMVVLIKRGPDVGKWAVIQQRADEVLFVALVPCALWTSRYFFLHQRAVPVLMGVFSYRTATCS
jgi:transcription elongation factor SPT5